MRRHTVRLKRRVNNMAQILLPFQTAVGNFSDSISSFFGVEERAFPRPPQPTSALIDVTVEADPHHFSAARWMLEIERCAGSHTFL